MKGYLIASLFISLLSTVTYAVDINVPVADPNAPADLTITNTVLRTRDKVPPLGAGGWGECGAINWAANNFISNSGNEPIYWKNYHRVTNCGANWFEIDGGGVTWFNLWGSGFLSGANLRIYRLVDKDGKSLPLTKKGDYIDVSIADHVLFVGTGQVIPEGAPDFPNGGWVCTKYTTVPVACYCRNCNLTITDTSLWLGNGKTYWYAVKAVTADNKESDISNEVSVTPAGSLDNGPHLLAITENNESLAIKPGGNLRLEPKVFGGKAPLQWAVVNEQGVSVALPDGLTLNPATGTVFGKPTAALDDFALRLKVTDSDGRSEIRIWMINPKPSADVVSKELPTPPTELKAVTGKNGSVTLTWKASPSPNVLSYKLLRSTVPAAQQENRAYVTKDTPALEKYDYVILERKFDPFDMKYVSTRVRNVPVGNPQDIAHWYWHGDETKLSFSLVPHPKPVPAEMVDPGETCMQVKAAGPGEQSIMQGGFIGTAHGYESLWYGQLEPGKKYRLEVWLRQEGLGNNGTVKFSYGRGDGVPFGYPNIKQTFDVNNEWKKYTSDFEGPDRPKDPLHFGPQFTFTGPGILWMDNCRIFRYDHPEDVDKPYVPNATVLDELVRSQPATGTKSAHRSAGLSRNMTMSSFLSWHANTTVSVDWVTGIRGTATMTLPMILTFDLKTGKDPQTRMRPWLLMQHILHSEQDWQNFIEYLAAPYDPKKDTPTSKPWAYLRCQQRGINTPWTDEFAEIIVEMGNETWHNGWVDEWLGFSMHNWVMQGGKEYGLFTRYICDTMRKSPYWKSENLDQKIRISLGANYDGRVDKDNTIHGYGEEAMQVNPYATILGHANYVGPKWETGDYSARNYDDHGVQECLVSFLTGPDKSEIGMMQAHDALIKSSHNYDISAYEGGSGGYALPVPGQVSPEQVETNEKYGKSLAQAVGAFDAWMHSYTYGWTYQLFSAYGEGNNWTSHTDFADGFRPSTAWLALTLRNYASGDLISVSENSLPSYLRHVTKNKKEIITNLPLIGVYAFRDGAKYSVFIISRKLDGQHDGIDFGDGYSPVTLHLPFAKAGMVTLHTLTGDPRQTNREKMNINIQSKELPTAVVNNNSLVINEQSGGGKNGMPPGSIFLYVLENTEKK